MRRDRAVLCFVVGTLIMHGAIGPAMAQRRRLIAVLRVLVEPLRTMQSRSSPSPGPSIWGRDRRR